MPQVILDITSVHVKVTKKELQTMKKFGNIPQSVKALALSKLIEMDKSGEPIIYNFDEE